MINYTNIEKSLRNFKKAYPFSHCIVDNFFEKSMAHNLSKEFLDYENPKWYYYDSALENKKTINNWNIFPENTYKVFAELMSGVMISTLERTTGCKLYNDSGLHGAGWHIHSNDGNLNPHLDYSIHPKLRLQRKINIIIYLEESLTDENGGHLGLWSHDLEKNKISNLIKEIQPKFNRAIIFDTTQNSWHGMSRPLKLPNNIYRKSIAIYYLTESGDQISQRERALYSPSEEQKNDREILELIKIRADKNEYSTAYRKN